MLKKEKILIVFGIFITLSSVFFLFSRATPTLKEISPSPNLIGKTYGVESETQSKTISPAPVIKNNTANQAEPRKEAVPTKNTESITIIAGEEKINLSVPPDTIFYDALVETQNIGKITFSGKNYPGLGFFMTDIGSLHSGNGKDLLYYVNGKQASVGVSSYVLNDGDVLEWKLE